MSTNPSNGAGTPPTDADIIRTSGISRSTVEKARTDMESLGMIYRRHQGKTSTWHITSTANLTQLAMSLGVMDDVQAQISLYRYQRAAWHAYLDRFLDQGIKEMSLHDAEREEHWIPPDDDTAGSLWEAA